MKSPQPKFQAHRSQGTKGKAAVVAVVGSCLLLALFANVLVNKQRTVRDALRTQAEQINTMNAHLLKLTERISSLGEVPLAFAETADGLEYVPAHLGISVEDLEFLKRFRGPLLDLDADIHSFGAERLSRELRRALQSSFAQNEDNLELAESRRQALITYAQLRVRGSMPTYEVRASVPNDLESMILGTSGNCSDFTLRMLMVAESLGMQAALISVNTPAFPGHVFVDAYDPQEDTAYLIDANFNVQVTRRNSGGKGFFEGLLTGGGNGDYSVNTMPVYFRFVDPGEKGLLGTPIDTNAINATRHRRKASWRQLLSDDVNALKQWWLSTPTHRPRTLKEFRTFLDEIPAEFDSSGDYAARLRQAAGVALDMDR